MGTSAEERGDQTSKKNLQPKITEGSDMGHAKKKKIAYENMPGGQGGGAFVE